MNTDAQQLRTRLFNVVPAASFQMEKLLGLVDVVFSDAVPTAAVECSTSPRMLLNPDFVERHCRRDGHLLMLVLHELHHLILGHTRLFPRLTLAHNIAFDAVINAMLCRQFPGEADFFRSTNTWEGFPGRLLRPAPGWPEAPEPLPDDARDAERKVHALLYGDGGQQVTYHELFDLLLHEVEARGGGEATLLGDHGGPQCSGVADELAQRDGLMRDVLRRIVEGWPPPDRLLAGRDTGRETREWSLDTEATPERALRQALRRLLARVGIRGAQAQRHRRAVRVEESMRIGTVLPQAGDRRAHTWTLLHGRPPVIWRGEGVQARRLRRPVPLAHVYLDISGSMNPALPALGAALRVPHHEGSLRLFVFSTVVDEARPTELGQQRFANTMGTDIRCVLSHLASLPPHRRPRRVVLLTDGYVGAVDPAELATLRVALFVGHYARYGSESANDLVRAARHIERLPALPERGDGA